MKSQNVWGDVEMTVGRWQDHGQNDKRDCLKQDFLDTVVAKRTSWQVRAVRHRVQKEFLSTRTVITKDMEGNRSFEYFDLWMIDWFSMTGS